MLLAVAFKACLIMWMIGRKTRGRDGYDSVDDSAADALVAQSHELSYKRLRNLYLSVYGLAT